jgi:hypothetical protein
MNNTLANQISDFEPVDGNWLPLEVLFESAFSSIKPVAYYPAIFALFEQFPDDDGAGVFWSALHGMEAVGEYEEDLLNSFQRHPTLMVEAMLIRLRNAGETIVEGIPIDQLITL